MHVSPPEGLQVDRQLHLQAEKALKEAKVKTVSQVKVRISPRLRRPQSASDTQSLHIH